MISNPLRRAIAAAFATLALVLAAFLIAPSTAHAQTPAGYKYCIGAYGTISNTCWGETTLFATPAEVCEANLLATRQGYPAWIWWEVYEPPSPNVPGLGGAPHGWCRKWSNTGFGNSNFLVARVGRPAYEIEVQGPLHTKALPAGPALALVASVREVGGARVAGMAVRIVIAGAAGGELAGVTDAGGEFRFHYVPPLQRPAVDELTATCSSCDKPVKKAVTVEACDVCEAH